jgi:hypothetical protein
MSNNTSETLGWLGSLLATFMSYAKWHSIGWAILHFCLGWIYVIYYLFTYGVPKLPH